VPERLLPTALGDGDPEMSRRRAARFRAKPSLEGVPSGSAAAIQSRIQGQVVDRLEPLEGDEDLALGLELAKHGAQDRLELEGAAGGDAIGRGPCEGLEVRTEPRRLRDLDRDDRLERRGERGV